MFKPRRRFLNSVFSDLLSLWRFEFVSDFEIRASGFKSRAFCAGFAGYQNLEDTFVFTTINGRPAFRYTARFTMRGQPHFEYFVRVLGDELTAMFFVMASSAEIDAIRRDIDQMAATIRVP
jgi:hypothetical protein